MSMNMRFALLSIILSALLATIAANPEPGSLIGGLMMPRMNPISQLELLRNLESTADNCNIEIRKVEKIAGKCIDLGNSNSRGCAAGIYMEPFHTDCMND